MIIIIHILYSFLVKRLWTLPTKLIDQIIENTAKKNAKINKKLVLLHIKCSLFCFSTPCIIFVARTQDQCEFVTKQNETQQNRGLNIDQ